jgi:uncharacterized protein (TIGR00290 family)
MVDSKSDYSRSHGLKKQLVARQASALGINLIQQESDFSNYEPNFKQVIKTLKEKGVTGGVFGDIYLMEHRTWIERVCTEMDIKPFFPLWENDTRVLLNEFVNAGFKALTVSVNQSLLTQSWLGREIDESFSTDIIKLEGIDPCAENGEYHSFVYDGPIFQNSVSFEKGKEYSDNNHWFLELN